MDMCNAPGLPQRVDTLDTHYIGWVFDFVVPLSSSLQLDQVEYGVVSRE